MLGVGDLNNEGARDVVTGLTSMVFCVYFPVFAEMVEA